MPLAITLVALPAAARLERDLAYGSEAAQRLDLQTPSVTGYATVVFVHGGSLTTGDTSDADYGRV